jgi:hypothetical protein
MLSIHGGGMGWVEQAAANTASLAFKDRMESLGYKFDYAGSYATAETFLKRVADPNVSGLHIVSHANYRGYTLIGGKEVLTTPTGVLLLGTEGEAIYPQTLHHAQKFRKSLLYLNACGAGVGIRTQKIEKPQNAWNGLVSQYGSTYASSLKVGMATGDGLMPAYGPPGDPDASDNFRPFEPLQ